MEILHGSNQFVISTLLLSSVGLHDGQSSLLPENVDKPFWKYIVLDFQPLKFFVYMYPNNQILSVYMYN